MKYWKEQKFEMRKDIPCFLMHVMRGSKAEGRWESIEKGGQRPRRRKWKGGV